MTLKELSGRHCSEKAAAVPAHDATAMLNQLPGWELSKGAIAKAFKFNNFHETMAFVNAVAWISHRQNHHPDMEVGYNRCRIAYSTHSVGGLSENDFICAARVEALQG